MIRRAVAAVAILLAAGAATAAAQPAPPPEPSTAAAVRVGPFQVRPALVLRDVGYDSNVFNEPEDAQGDFTATAGARVDVGLQLPRVQATYTSLYEYVYFESFPAERGSNRGAEGRIDGLFGRLRPYASLGVEDSHERPTAEIDERARRQQSHVEIGLRAAAFSRTQVAIAYKRRDVDYAADERFRGVNLAGELNLRGESLLAGAEVALTPLTTVGVHAERLDERFELSPDRDATSYRVGATAALSPLALISGRATVGFRAFRPSGAALRRYTGITAAIAVGYSPRADTRLTLAVERDLRSSFERLTPYYVSTGGRVTITKQVIGRLDTQVFAGLERLAYEARLGVPPALAPDRVRTLGAGIGYRVGQDARLGVNLERNSRSSPVPRREYARDRVYTTLSYGF
jgi:hypothetical protein